MPSVAVGSVVNCRVHEVPHGGAVFQTIHPSMCYTQLLFGFHQPSLLLQTVNHSINPSAINQSINTSTHPSSPTIGTNPCHLPEDIPMVSISTRSHLAPTSKSSVGLNNRPCRSPVNCRPLQTVSADSLHTAGPCEGSKRSRETLMKPIDMTAQNQGKGTPRRRDDRRAQ